MYVKSVNIPLDNFLCKLTQKAGLKEGYREVGMLITLKIVLFGLEQLCTKNLAPAEDLSLTSYVDKIRCDIFVKNTIKFQLIIIKNLSGTPFADKSAKYKPMNCDH